MGRKKGYIYFSDKPISDLKALYSEEILRGLVDAQKFDIILGMALGKKGGRISENGSLKFYRKVSEVVPQSELKNYQESELFSSGKKYYREVLRDYSDKETLLMTKIYDEVIYGNFVEPDLFWAETSPKYITEAYKQALTRAYEELLEQGNSWDYIAFAANVPLAPIGDLEDRIIATNDSLLILAFATDVKKANIKKLQRAIERCGNTRIVSRLLNDNETIVRVPVDHVGIFQQKFKERTEDQHE